MVVVASFSRVALGAGGTGNLVAITDNMDKAKYKQAVEENLFQSTTNLQLGKNILYVLIGQSRQCAQGKYKGVAWKVGNLWHDLKIVGENLHLGMEENG